MVNAAVDLPRLSKLQESAITSRHRFNVISGGRESGKMTLALDVALASDYGAIAGHPVLVCVPDLDTFISVKRKIIQIVEPLIDGKSGKNVINLVTQGSITILVCDGKDIDFYNQVSIVCVVRGAEIEGLYGLCHDVFIPSLNRYKGALWVFSKPKGLSNSFGRLFKECELGGQWRSFQLPSLANPKCDRSAVEADRKRMLPEVFGQEYEGDVVSTPIELSASQTIIGRDETFIQWCDRLSKDGMKVDGAPFRLDDRPAMRFVYEMVPTEIDEAFGKTLILMKCAQVGFTVMEMLAMIYMALKWMPCKIGMYLPDMKLAGIKSSERFLPIVRTIPPVYRMMTEDSPHGRTGEGNVLIRNLGGSRFHFMWTSGKAMTESIPLDVVSFDEVQEMTIADMEKTRERMSASRIRYTLMGSTANWPDRDIHYWYKLGKQWQFWTQCPSCGEYQILDDHFPECIRYSEELRDYHYACHVCSGVIEDSQMGEWRASNPNARMDSLHFPQFLSPTISPREIIESYHNADDMKNFYNRKRGKPYTDPSQVPINLEMLNDCARIGMSMGLVWKERAKDTFMGIDQMGAFNVVLIAERLSTGHLAIVHAEEIFDNDPFARCDVLMDQYGVTVCVVETLPNYNDAKRFAGRFPGRVFLAGYTEMKDEMLRWGDAVPNRQERKTSEEDRDRYTVTLDQYKCMQVAMARIQNRITIFPNPDGLVQEVVEKGKRLRIPILKDHVFLHFTRTALVAERDEEEKKYRRRVVKVGMDPHFSYAYMLLNVAWARAHGNTMFLMQDATETPEPVQAIIDNMPGLPSAVVNFVEAAYTGEVCGNCVNFDGGSCTSRNFIVLPTDAGCHEYLPK